MGAGDRRIQNRGLKTAIGSVGSLLAPALVAVLIRYVPPEGVFSIAATLILLTALVVFLALRLPIRTGARDLAWEASQERVMAARTVLRNVTVSAATARKLRDAA